MREGTAFATFHKDRIVGWPRDHGAESRPAVLLKSGVRGHDQALELRNAYDCIDNLRLIEKLKAYNAKDRKDRGEAVSDDSPVDREAVEALMRGGVPRCPSGGVYDYGATLGDPASCSIHAPADSSEMEQE
jgi:hypothetical protein